MMKTSPCQAQKLVFVTYSSGSCTSPEIHLYQTRATEELNPRQKGLRDRNSPTCTLSQNGYGETCSQTLESQSELLQNKNLLLLQCLKPKPEFCSLLNLLQL